MSRVYNVRGCSGAGKTWVVNQVMAQSDRITTDLDDRNKLVGYLMEFSHREPLYLVGRYETACGGCDTIKTMAEVKARVKEHAGSTQVLYEGLLWSTVWKSSWELAEELRSQQIEHVWLHLNTPLDTCLAQIKQRWDARGKDGELSDRLRLNALSKWNTNQKVYHQAAETYPNLAHWLSADDAVDLIMRGGSQ
jgi:hypothetical protein